MYEVLGASLTQEANEIADACDREIRQIQPLLDDRYEGVAGDLVLVCKYEPQGLTLQLYILLEVFSDGGLATTPVRIENPGRVFGEHAEMIRSDDPAAVWVARALTLAKIINRLLMAVAEIDDTLDEAFALGVVGDRGVEVGFEDPDGDGDWYRTGRRLD